MDIASITRPEEIEQVRSRLIDFARFFSNNIQPTNLNVYTDAHGQDVDTHIEEHSQTIDVATRCYSAYRIFSKARFCDEDSMYKVQKCEVNSTVVRRV